MVAEKVVGDHVHRTCIWGTSAYPINAHRIHGGVVVRWYWFVANLYLDSTRTCLGTSYLSFGVFLLRACSLTGNYTSKSFFIISYQLCPCRLFIDGSRSASVKYQTSPVHSESITFSTFLLLLFFFGKQVLSMHDENAIVTCNSRWKVRCFPERWNINFFVISFNYLRYQRWEGEYE